MSLLKAEAFFLFLFSGTQNVMSAEKVLLEAQIPCMVMPLPTALSASCGLAIRIYPADRDRVETLLDIAKIQPASVYFGKKEKNETTYQPVVCTLGCDEMKKGLS